MTFARASFGKNHDFIVNLNAITLPFWLLSGSHDLYYPIIQLGPWQWNGLCSTLQRIEATLTIRALWGNPGEQTQPQKCVPPAPLFVHLVCIDVTRLARDWCACRSMLITVLWHVACYIRRQTDWLQQQHELRAANWNAHLVWVPTPVHSFMFDQDFLKRTEPT